MVAAATETKREKAGLQRLAGENSFLWTALAALLAAPLIRQIAGPSIDPDYWWHLATGRWILDHHRVPTTDPFSYTHLGQTWYAHEWLAELLIAAVNRIAGYAGDLILFSLILSALL